MHKEIHTAAPHIVTAAMLSTKDAPKAASSTGLQSSSSSSSSSVFISSLSDALEASGLAADEHQHFVWAALAWPSRLLRYRQAPFGCSCPDPQPVWRLEIEQSQSKLSALSPQKQIRKQS